MEVVIVHSVPRVCCENSERDSIRFRLIPFIFVRGVGEAVSLTLSNAKPCTAMAAQANG